MTLKHHILATFAWVAVCIAILLASPASWTSRAVTATPIHAAHDTAGSAGTTVGFPEND